MSADPKPRMTDEEVTKLARDLVTNLVFMSDRCRRAEDIPMVFLSFALAGPEIIETYKKEGIIHLYEYFSKAGPMGFNGYPIFYSNYAINKPDYERVLAEELRMRKALGEPCPDPQETSKSSAVTTPPSQTQDGLTNPPPSSRGSGSRKPSRRTRK